MRRSFGVALVVLMFGAAVVAQQGVTGAKSTAEAATIKTEAEKCSRAFIAGDFGRVIDSTYPRLIEMSGGKTELLKEIEKSMKAIRDAGLKMVSHAVGEPEPSVRAGAMLLSVVPTTLKMESPDSFLTSPSFWLAVSTNDRKSWTFIDGSFLNPESLKIILPEAVDKIKLHVKGQLVIERKPAG